MDYILPIPVPENRKDPLNLVNHLEEALPNLRVGSAVTLRIPINDFGLQQMFTDDSTLQAAIVSAASPGFHRQIDDLIKYVEGIEHETHRTRILAGLRKLRGAV